MAFDIASLEDAAEICDLLNLAYRGEAGWTTEHKLISGLRCKPDDVRVELQAPDSVMLLKKLNEKIVACILVKRMGDNASIGSFAVLPALQNAGLGKEMLRQAEYYAQQHWQVACFVMSILSNRDELLAFYQRRGYLKTGHSVAFPVHLDVGQPLVENQTLDELVKCAKATREAEV